MANPRDSESTTAGLLLPTGWLPRGHGYPVFLPWSNRGVLSFVLRPEEALPLGLPLHLDQKQNEDSLGAEPMLPSSVSQNPDKQTQLSLRKFGKLLRLRFWNVRQRLMCSSQAHHLRSLLKMQSSRLQRPLGHGAWLMEAGP